MKASKRFVALLLCVLMALSSVSALADLYYVPNAKRVNETAKAEDADSGKTEDTTETGTEEKGKAEDPAGTGEGESAEEGKEESGEPTVPPPELPDQIDTKDEAKEEKEEEAEPAKPKKRWVWNRTDASWTHRVFVDENLTLMETLQRIGENSDRVLNTGAEFTVAYADRVLYPEQFEIFDNLDIQEQLYLIVAAAGHWDAVADVPLSEDAQLIYDQLIRNPRRHIQARQKYFPVKAIRIKGKLYKSFYVEIAVSNGYKERDRFVFAYYQNEWQLMQIINGEYRTVKAAAKTK